MNDLVATTYQTQGKDLDSALTAREKKSVVVKDQKRYPCANNLVGIVNVGNNNLLPTLKFDIDVIRLQLLIRQKMAEINIKDLERKINDFWVTISVNDYIRITSPPNTTPSEVTKRNTTLAIKRASLLLQHMTFIIRSGHVTSRFNLVNCVVQSRGVFSLRIAPEIIKLITTYTKQLPNKKHVQRSSQGLLTKFTTKIYSLNSSNAMLTQFYLDTRYSIRNNIVQNVNDCISIKSIAEFLQLPKTKEEVKGKINSTNYYREMVQPVINSLDKLQDKGLIEYYLYESKKDKPLSEKRLMELRSTPEVFLENVKICFKSYDLEPYVQEVLRSKTEH